MGEKSMEYIVLSYNERELLKCRYNGETAEQVAAAVSSVAACAGVPDRHIDVHIETPGGGRRDYGDD
jgi:hypothetical protein